MSSRAAKPWHRNLRDLFILAVALALIYAYQTRNLILADGRPAPQLAGQLVGGGELDLRQLTAERTLIYFVAPWCAYCAVSMGNIERVRRWRSDDSLSIVFVALDWESEEQMTAYMQKHNIDVPVILADSDTAEQWSIYAFPTYYVLGGDHEIISRDMGYSTTLGLFLRTM